MENIAKEVQMLRIKRDNLRRTSWLFLEPADEARLLQTECELYERMLVHGRCSYGFHRDALKRDLKYAFNGNQLTSDAPSDEYNAWVSTHVDIHDETCSGTLNVCFRCSKRSCIHYVYGLPTPEALLKHFKEQHSEILSTQPSVIREDHISRNETPVTCQDASDEPTHDADFVYVLFDSSSGQKRKPQKQPSQRKQKKQRNGSEVIKPDRQHNPCFRCKILKKECDDETPCKQCPQQGFTEKGDYWKAIGCFRTLSESLVGAFLPDSFYESLGSPDNIDSPYDMTAFWCQTLCQGTSLVTKSQDFDTFTEGLGCPRSLSGFLAKLRGCKHTFEEFELRTWLPPVWTLFQIQNTNKANTNAKVLDICILFQSDVLADNTKYEIETTGLAILLLEQTSSPLKQGANSAGTSTIAVKRAMSVLCDACQRRKSRCVIAEGKAACVLCLVESQVCSFESNARRQSENWNGNGKERSETINNNSNKAINNSVFHYLSGALEVFLDSTFSVNCCRRKYLDPDDWILTFTHICLCSILKSLLIEAQAALGVGKNSSRADVATCIDSAYKVLVSIFVWAARSDLLVAWYHSDGMKDLLSPDEEEMFRTLCRLVQRDKWEERGIKTSKDFLMGLGSGFYNDGTYNGFYVPRYGVKGP